MRQGSSGLFIGVGGEGGSGTERENGKGRRGRAMEPEFVEGRDYYVDEEGKFVYTGIYLRSRGYCCGLGCRHCPYGFTGDPGSGDTSESGNPPEPTADSSGGG